MIETFNDILHSFKIDASCVDANRHRHFSYYDLALNPGCRINKIARYSREIAIALRARTPIIVNPIPHEGIVRLHTTHDAADTLHFNELYNYYYNNYPIYGILPILLGETDEGKPLWIDLVRNPHILVAGGTGSGKSVLMHTIIANAALRNDVSLYLADTKKVEFNPYQRKEFSHKLNFCANDYSSAIAMLEHLYDKMENRYNYLCSKGLSSIEDNPNIFDKVLVVMDEVSDLMLYDKKQKYFENLVVKLAQKARAAGIYMVLATQRPSVDVLTGLIKANFPARIACKVNSKVDSRVVLDSHGAESLAGRGDAIIKSLDNDHTRFQVAYVDPVNTVFNYGLMNKYVCN
jgi:S-DNA-T family DNA segregation ATPase FtsK/SpoIIIE